MKNIDWLKKNWFKLGIIAAVLILALSLFNLGNTRIAGTTTEESLSKSIQCKRDGEQKFEEDKNAATQEKYKPDVLNCYYYNPVYIYSPILNTCLYSGGYTCDLTHKYTDGIFKGEPAKRWTRHIVDIYTNKSLSEVYVDDSSNISDWINTQINQFWDESARLGF